MASNDPDSEKKAADALGYTWNHRSTRGFSVSTKRRRFKPWTDSIQCSRSHPVGQSGIDLNTTAMARSRSMLLWM